MYRKRLLMFLVLLTLVLVTLPGCIQEAAETGTQPTTILLPDGDPEAGRRAFKSLGCALCHLAAGDRGLPRPASTTVGPVLGPEQVGQSTASLVESILNPSHKVPGSMEDEAVSPMVDYTDITVRQLSDVIAYIRYLGE